MNFIIRKYILNLWITEFTILEVFIRVKNYIIKFIKIIIRLIIDDIYSD